MEKSATELWRDYAAFHRYMTVSKDLDPVYPVLRSFLLERGVDPGSEAGLWLTVCHLTWYDMGSTMAAWQGDSVRWDGGWPCATERRGNRDRAQLEANVNSWLDHAEAAGSLRSFLGSALTADPGESWVRLRARVEEVQQNGRWASYKMAEMLQKVNGWRLRPLDMGNAHSSGPRKGMDLLVMGLPTGNKPEDIRKLDGVGASIAATLTGFGLTAPIEEVETTLCDFHSMAVGRYYVGHDIDKMDAQLLATPSANVEAAYRARAAVLPKEYLGELNGWRGVDRDRMKEYRDNGSIMVR